jgi:MYXO-CTERM domain-containing protein
VGGFAVALAVTLLAAPSARANTLHVDDDYTGASTGTATNPYRTLAAAIAAAKDGDEIRVAGGTYAPITIEDKLLTLLGGWDAGFGGRGSAADRSIISGSAGVDCVTLFNARTTIVDGFVIRAGRYGVHVDSDDFKDSDPGRSAPSVRNNLIEDNGSAAGGGGVFVDNSRGTRIEGNLIRRNQGDRGAAIAVDSPAVRIAANRFEKNLGHGDHGGALYLTGADLEVENNWIEGGRTGDDPGYGWGGGCVLFNEGASALFRGNVWTQNHAPLIGSALFIDDGAKARVDHDLFYRNECAERGGHAIYVDGTDSGVGSSVEIVNVTVADHACPAGEGGGVYVERYSSVKVRNSIFWQNGGDDFAVDATSTITVAYTLSQEAVAGTGNLGGDPLFASAATGDFYVKSKVGRFNPATHNFDRDGVDSPTIDRGDPAADFANEPGPNGLRINLGHTGGTARASMGGPGGVPPADAGPLDGDAGLSWTDGGPLPDGADAGMNPAGGGGGSSCGCRTGGRPTTPALALLLLGVLLSVSRRR